MRGAIHKTLRAVLLTAALLLFLGLFSRCEAFAAKTAARTWKVTQYGHRDARQQYMFYTIRSSTGKLLVIDGGWTYNADYVRGVIGSLGNRVDGWIITHPHPDHVGALNEILQNNYTKIRIGKIYTTRVRVKQYKATQQPWDEYDCFKTFCKLTRNSKKLVYLKEGDELNLTGLRVRVLNAWDKTIDQLSKDQCNHGSLCFKLEGKKRSMLFCGDVGTPRQKRHLKKYKKILPSDYVQCAHHGNWGLTAAFYKTVSPKRAFFDAPRWITEDTTGKYDAPQLIAYFRANGVKVLPFGTSGSNSVTLG